MAEHQSIRNSPRIIIYKSIFISVSVFHKILQKHIRAASQSIHQNKILEAARICHKDYLIYLDSRQSSRSFSIAARSIFWPMKTIFCIRSPYVSSQSFIMEGFSFLKLSNSSWGMVAYHC